MIIYISSILAKNVLYILMIHTSYIQKIEYIIIKNIIYLGVQYHFEDSVKYAHTLDASYYHHHYVQGYVTSSVE